MPPRRYTQNRRGPRPPKRRESSSAAAETATLPRPTAPVEIGPSVVVQDLASAMGVSTASVISELIRNGIFATINQSIDYDTASLVAAEMGMELIPKGGGDGGDGDAPELVAPGPRRTVSGSRPGATTTRPTSSAGADRHDHGPRRSRRTTSWTPSGIPRSPPANRVASPSISAPPRRSTATDGSCFSTRLATSVHRHAGPGCAGDGHRGHRGRRR